MLRRWTYGFATLAALALIWAGCEWVADIPDRGSNNSPCAQYCALAGELCTKQFALFKQECPTTCALYSKEERECRQNELEKLQNSSSEEAYLYCSNASPSGGSKCGESRCGNYCKYMTDVCAEVDPEMFVTYPEPGADNQDDCEKKCEVLTDRQMSLSGSSDSGYDVSRDHEGDTLQCRFVHLALATKSPEYAKDHCWHAWIAPRPQKLGATTQAAPCATPVETNHVPRCQDYCNVIMRACAEDEAGDHAVYESKSECIAACEAFPKGSMADDASQNTLACRIIHAYNAAVYPAPETHCPHAGPGGAGVCGDDCPSYCALLKQGCPDQFESEHAGSAEACERACVADRDADGGDKGASYSIAKAKSGDPIACRLYHAVKAAAAMGNDTQEVCQVATGLSKCPFPQK